MSRRAIVAVVLVLAIAGGVIAIALAAGDDDSGGVATVATTTTTSAPEPTTAGTQPPGSSTTVASECPAQPEQHDVRVGPMGAVQLLTDVQVEAPAACTDVVEFSFRPNGEAPSARVSYRTPPFTQDPTGEPLTVTGNAFLVVRFEPARTADIDVNPIVDTYTGPDTIEPQGTSFVKQVQLAGDFEAVVTWIIGLDSKRPFEVQSVPGLLTVTIT